MATVSTPPFQLAAPVPALLWDTFEEALKTGIRRLAKDIAATIGQPEGPLLNAILKDPKAMIRPYLVEESPSNPSAAEKEVDMRCGYVCQRPDAPLFLQACRQPVVWEAAERHGRCAEHLYAVARPVPKSLPVLTPLEWMDGEESGPLFRTEDGMVVDSAFAPRGRYDLESGVLTLFELPAVAPDAEN